MKLFLYLYSIKCKKQRNIFKYKNNVQPLKIQIPLNGTRILHYCMPPPTVRDHCRRGGERVLRAGGGRHKETEPSRHSRAVAVVITACARPVQAQAQTAACREVGMMSHRQLSTTALQQQATQPGISRQHPQVWYTHSGADRELIGLRGVGVGTHMIQKPLHEILKEPIKI